MLAIAVAALAWTLAHVGMSELVGRAARIGPWFAVVLAIEGLGSLSDAAGLRRLLRPADVPFSSVLRAQVACRSTNLVTPLGSAGEVVKLTMLLDHVSRARAVTAVLLHNLLALAQSLVVVAAGMPFAWWLLGAHHRDGWLLVGGAMAALLAISMPLLLVRGWMTASISIGARVARIRPERTARWLDRTHAMERELREAVRRPRDMLVALGWATASRLLAWAGTSVLVVAAGSDVGVGQLAAILAVSKALQWASQVAPFGIGAAEGAHYAVFAQLGLAPGAGVAVVLARRAIHVAYAAVGLGAVVTREAVRAARSDPDAR
jgi:uncharacterized membrane protein YbhN (UPF0104 family)